jgi:hypothetical protein
MFSLGANNFRSGVHKKGDVLVDHPAGLGPDTQWLEVKNVLRRC